MGKHVGWRVRKLSTGAKRHQGVAYDPATQRDQTRSFATAAEARTWAQHRAAEFRAAVDSLASARATGDAAALAGEYVQDLERRRLAAWHIHGVRQALATFTAAVPALVHPRSGAQAQAWIDALSAPLAATVGTATAGAVRSPYTVQRYLATARAFLRWCRDRDVLTARQDPLRHVVAPKLPKTLKPQFSLAELRTIVAAVGDPYHLRACLQLYAGLRAQEAHHLHWSRPDAPGIWGQIHWPDTILIRGKGAKDRLVPLQPELRAVLEPLRQPAGPLFPERVRHLQNAQHRRDFLQFLGRLGIPVEERTPHSFRHCYAGLQTASGVPSLLLAAYMGHAAMATTAGYATAAARYAGEVQAAGWRPGVFQLTALPVP